MSRALLRWLPARPPRARGTQAPRQVATSNAGPGGRGWPRGSDSTKAVFARLDCPGGGHHGEDQLGRARGAGGPAVQPPFGRTGSARKNAPTTRTTRITVRTPSASAKDTARWSRPAKPRFVGPEFSSGQSAVEARSLGADPRNNRRSVRMTQCKARTKITTILAAITTATRGCLTAR
jgi:hypothetical protein